MAVKPLYRCSDCLVPYENVAVFTTARHKALVGTTKRTADEAVTARVTKELLNGLPRCQIDELRLAILLVDEQMPRVTADADRCRARLQLQLVLEFPRVGVVQVNGCCVIHGGQPSSIWRAAQILNSVLLAPFDYLVAIHAVRAKTVVLIEGPDYKRLSVIGPDAADNWLSKASCLLNEIPRLLMSLATASSQPSLATYPDVPQSSVFVLRACYNHRIVRAPDDVADAGLVPVQRAVEAKVLVPDHDLFAAPTRCQHRPVWRELNVPRLAIQP